MADHQNLSYTPLVDGVGRFSASPSFLLRQAERRNQSVASERAPRRSGLPPLRGGFTIWDGTAPVKVTLQSNDISYNQIGRKDGRDRGSRRFGAKPRKNFVDDHAASPSSWKTPRMAVWMAA